MANEQNAIMIEYKRIFPGAIAVLLVFPLSILALGWLIKGTAGRVGASPQESSLDFPTDATRVYYKNPQDRFVALPFESSISSVNPFVPALKDKISFAELKGSQAATALTNHDPHFYVFVADRWDPPPHQLIQLRGKKSTRRFTIISLKGRKGYSPLANESIRLEYRLLERLPVEIVKGRSLFINYVEIHPRRQLAPGEYAIIGDSLSDIATFRIQ
ncbi:MAG: hypothetical protein ABI923_02135 [bacterium]